MFILNAANNSRSLSLSISCVLTMLVSFLTMSSASAHVSKGYDKNGGHYDDFGSYHCHIQGCRMTESRFQFRRNRLSNRDQDLFYNEDDWPHWEIMSGGCKTMRTEVLEISSLVPVTWTNPRQCEIREGLWVDEYTGEEYTRAAQLEIDHIIPLQYANASNGYMWDDQKRMLFANDPINLIPVGRDTARKKRQRGIGYWQPRDEHMCDYATAWQQTAAKYDLDLFSRDRSRMNRTLDECMPDNNEDIDVD